MDHPDEPYHIRPFPRQPHRGGKELLEELSDLEGLLSESLPDLERLRTIQARVHTTANTYTDDLLVDMIRQMSNDIDLYHQNPNKKILLSIVKQILKIRIQLKHL